LPLFCPTLHAVQPMRFAFEDRQVQIDGGIERLSGELLVPAECFVEILGRVAGQ
jgi:hypothetical protein